MGKEFWIREGFNVHEHLFGGSVGKYFSAAIGPQLPAG